MRLTRITTITMVTSNIFGREQWQTYAVVVAPNTKRVTAAALKCTIVASGVCGLMKEEWKVILYNCEKVRSANHEMKIPVLVCWKRSTEKSSWRCANKERKRVENNQIPRREQKKLDVWILKRTDGQASMTWFKRFSSVPLICEWRSGRDSPRLQWRTQISQWK